MFIATDNELCSFSFTNQGMTSFFFFKVETADDVEYFPTYLTKHQMTYH